MSTLLAIRHGRTPANAQGILAGRAVGVYLDEVGQLSAETLSARMQSVPVVQVIVSPLERTKQTAEIVFPQHAAIVYDERLVECDYGDWQGQSLTELATHDLWSTVQSNPQEMVFPNGESMLDMYNRTVESVREWDQLISAEHGSDAIWAIVSHGDIIKSVCADALGLPLNKFQSLMLEPTSVSVIHYGTNTGVSKLNDTGADWLSALKPIKQEPTLGGQTGSDS